MRFEEGRVGWSSTVQRDKTKNFPYKEYQGFSVSYTCCAGDTSATNRYSSCPLGI